MPFDYFYRSLKPFSFLQVLILQDMLQALICYQMSLRKKYFLLV